MALFSPKVNTSAILWFQLLFRPCCLVSGWRGSPGGFAFARGKQCRAQDRDGCTVAHPACQQGVFKRCRCKGALRKKRLTVAAAGVYQLAVLPASLLQVRAEGDFSLSVDSADQASVCCSFCCCSTLLALWLLARCGVSRPGVLASWATMQLPESACHRWPGDAGRGCLAARLGFCCLLCGADASSADQLLLLEKNVNQTNCWTAAAELAQVWVLGQSPEFGHCKATKKVGAAACAASCLPVVKGPLLTALASHSLVTARPRRRGGSWAAAAAA